MRFIYTKAFAFFSAFVIIVALVTFLVVKGWASPIQAVFVNAQRPVSAVSSGIGRPLESFFSTVYNLRKISRENAALTSQVYGLQQQLVGYDQAQRENDALKKELGFIASSKQSFVPCTVLVENPLALTDTLILNCGSDDGVQVGQGVLSQGYLIGKIIYAGKSSSTALLVTSSQFSTDALVSKTAAKGIAEGFFGSGIILDQLSQTDAVEQGDLVVTAGISDEIPKNILIGQVGEVLSTQNDLFKKTTVLSPIDFSNLQFVFVTQ